jgi:glycolate oxidase FAD binding subunit
LWLQLINQNISAALQAQVQEAVAKRQPLAIVGGDSKCFLQVADATGRLELSGHAGIIDYEPSELFIMARAGTPLAEIEAALAEKNQMLGCEPPHFDSESGTATLGGTVACGFSGPRRPYAGSLRDHMLGVKLLNGEGEIVQFGGQVMKNVAGFDVSRLMVGARGTLGALLEITLKVLPKPEVEETLVFECLLADALKRMSILARRPLPLSGLAWVEGHIFMRLDGTEAAIRAAHAKIGGEITSSSAHFWQSLREQTHIFFNHAQPLWRLSLPLASEMDIPENELLMDWGGALRWWHTARPAQEIEAMAHSQGGHACLFRDQSPVPGAMPPTGLLPLHQRLKKAFDPHGLFNPGILGVS